MLEMVVSLAAEGDLSMIFEMWKPQTVKLLSNFNMPHLLFVPLLLLHLLLFTRIKGYLVSNL